MLQLNIIGHLGTDAVEKEINGKKYISLRVASTAKRGGKDVTTWVSVMYYFNDKLLPYLRKGVQVFASGEMSVSTYTNKDGVTNVDVSLWANVLQLVGKVERPTPTADNPQTWDEITRIEMQRAKTTTTTDELPFD